ncbi:sugar ABC transporter substrate-binding protein [Paenibacillus sp.]|uniref:sugar ABC transporter substrate-binding protein n=1 Tax=Paenibacillus sp. TaxID=58172 RepID=UPI00356525A8
MQRSLKHLLTTVIAILLVGVMSACGNGNGNGGNETSSANTNKAAGDSSNQAEGSKEKAPLKVGFAVPDEAHPYFIAQIGAIKKRVQEQGGELLVANAGMDVNKQINNIENLVSSKVQAMIVFPIDPKPLEDSLKKAQDAGIRVVGWGSFGIEHADVVVNSDHTAVGTAVGEDAAKWINEKFGGNAEVGLIISTYNPGLTERGVALEAAIKKNAPNAKIVAKHEALTVADSQKVAENLLTAHPNIQVIATIDDSEALGAYEAVKSHGKATGHFYINGVGATPEMLTKLKEEGSVLRTTLDMATSKNPIIIVDNILKLLGGESVERDQLSKLTIVNASNADAFMPK